LVFTVYPYFKVQVRPGASSCGTNLGDDIYRFDRLPLGDENFRAMSVESDETASFVAFCNWLNITI